MLCWPNAVLKIVIMTSKHTNATFPPLHNIATISHVQIQWAALHNDRWMHRGFELSHENIQYDFDCNRTISDELKNCAMHETLNGISP